MRKEEENMSESLVITFTNVTHVTIIGPSVRNDVKA